MSEKFDDTFQASSNKAEEGIDKKQLDEVKDIVNQIEKVFSQMKIFSSDHENVETFIDLLFVKMSQYLQKHWKLEIGIEEFSFTFKGIPFYTERKTAKSLPYLFHKDGLKMLFFYKGLLRDELKQFLEIVKEDSSLPPEESDIVISLWEKDFANIQYFAPDDYLESKIGIGMEVPEYKIDKKKLFSGKINLKPEDKSFLDNKDDSSVEESFKKTFEKGWGTEEKRLSKSEEELLLDMVQNHRKESEEKQLKTLMIDILYLEKRPEKVTSLIKQLINYVNQQINKGNFEIALSIYQEVLELKEYLSENDASKEKLVRKFFESSEIEITPPQAEEIFDKEDIKEFDAFLKYISFMGAKSIPVLSHLYDRMEKPEQKDKIITALKQVGKDNLSELVKIARDERPEITLEIIMILADSKEKRAMNHLVSFLSFRNKKVLHAAINAIGRFKNPSANKILFSLLSNEDPEIKSMAAENIHMVEEDPVFDKILQIIKDKKFLKETRKQKQALLLTLARSKSKKAFGLLEKIIKKAGFFSGVKRVESALCAVEALEKSENLSGYAIIKNMINSHNRKIRKKCADAANTFSRKIKEETSRE